MKQTIFGQELKKRLTQAGFEPDALTYWALRWDYEGLDQRKINPNMAQIVRNIAWKQQRIVVASETSAVVKIDDLTPRLKQEMRATTFEKLLGEEYGFAERKLKKMMAKGWQEDAAHLYLYPLEEDERYRRHPLVTIRLPRERKIISKGEYPNQLPKQMASYICQLVGDMIGK